MEIKFTVELFEQLKKEYHQALKDGKEVFLFDGKYELVTNYAKYLIEYLSTIFKNN